jgi:hypothetical protein
VELEFKAWHLNVASLPYYDILSVDLCTYLCVLVYMSKCQHLCNARVVVCVSTDMNVTVGDIRSFKYHLSVAFSDHPI